VVGACQNVQDVEKRFMRSSGRNSKNGELFARLPWKDWKEIKRMPTKDIKRRLKEISAYLEHTVGIVDLQYRDLASGTAGDRNETGENFGKIEFSVQYEGRGT
jgi:hypothetical protein